MPELIDTAEADAFRKGREAGRSLIAQGVGQHRLYALMEAAEAGSTNPAIGLIPREEMRGLGSVLRAHFEGRPTI